MDVASRLAAGDEAVRVGDWAAAREHFLAAAAAGGGEPAEASFGLATAAFWLGDMRAMIEQLERAYAAFRRRPEPLRAAQCALRLAFHHRQHLANPAAASGWLARAGRLIEDNRLEAVRGELLLLRAYLSDDAVAAELLAREALARGRATADLDLELEALAQLGAALVEQGRVAEGVALLDEAMTGASGGEAARLDTIVFTHGLTMITCARCAEFERAMHWVRAAERVADQRAVPFLLRECRAVHARVLFSLGEFRRAEEVARSVLDDQGQIPAYDAEALAVLAELRVAEGKLEEAERLVVGFEGYLPVVPVFTRVQLLMGKPALAETSAERALDTIGHRGLASAALTELLGEAEIAQGHADEAAERGRALAEQAAAVGCQLMLAYGQRLRGRALTTSQPLVARRQLDQALTSFVKLGMPYEVARTRFALAESLRAAEPEVAAREARASHATFEQLGAAGAVDAAAAFLRELGHKATRSSVRPREGLSRREEEVLALIGEGLSNPEIASRLCISRKTVEHHVAHLLDKLGLRSRAEAAVEVGRRASVKPAAR